MSLLDFKNVKKRETAAQIEASVRDAFTAILTCYTTNFQLIWNNPDHLTPQEVLDGLGTNAAELFALATLCKQAVNTARPASCTLTAPLTFTINPDGTITIVEQKMSL